MYLKITNSNSKQLITVDRLIVAMFDEVLAMWRVYCKCTTGAVGQSICNSYQDLDRCVWHNPATYFGSTHRALWECAQCCTDSDWLVVVSGFWGNIGLTGIWKRRSTWLLSNSNQLSSLNCPHDVNSKKNKCNSWPFSAIPGLLANTLRFSLTVSVYTHSISITVCWLNYLPYSGNLSWVKTFANFAVSGQFAKVLTAKIFIEYGGVIINGRVIVVSHNSREFSSRKSDLQQVEQKCPQIPPFHLLIVGVYHG